MKVTLSVVFTPNNNGAYVVSVTATDKDLALSTSATATWNITPSYILKSTVGMQYVDYRREGNGAFGDQLVPGATTPAGGTIFTVSSLYVPSKTLGQFIEEALAVNDRLYLTVAARTDQNSAFGTNFQNVLYPKASASWVTSDEPWFKTVDLQALPEGYAVVRHPRRTGKPLLKRLAYTPFTSGV